MKTKKLNQDQIKSVSWESHGRKGPVYLDLNKIDSLLLNQDEVIDRLNYKDGLKDCFGGHYPMWFTVTQAKKIAKSLNVPLIMI